MLNPATASTPIASAYLLATGLNTEGKPSGNAPTGNFPAAFADAYNTYATAGVVPGALNGGGDASIIQTFFNNVDNGSAVLNHMAHALAQFWATVAVAPGAPAHGGLSVISVTNNAASMAGVFASAIMASLTTEEKKPYFHHLVQNIQSIAVSQIVWEVTELMPGTPPSPATFPEGIQ